MSQPSRRTPNKTIQGTREPKGRRNLTVLLVVCALLVVGYLGFKHIKHDRAISMQLKEYQAAGVELSSLADKIVATHGRPADRKIYNYCTSVKANDGVERPHCITSLAIVYDVADKSTATGLASQAQALIHQASDASHITTQPNHSALATVAMSVSPNLNFHFNDSKELTCESNSIYTPLDDPVGTHAIFHELMLSFSCGVKPSLASYYPQAH
jgi:hypothetical protein